VRGAAPNHPAGVTTPHPGRADDPPVPVTAPIYVIRVRGRLSDATLASFEGMDAAVAPAETVLRGPVADQAGLHGLLERVQALGLELIEVRRLSPDDP
jgi:hypothetical protein